MTDIGKVWKKYSCLGGGVIGLAILKKEKKKKKGVTAIGQLGKYRIAVVSGKEEVKWGGAGWRTHMTKHALGMLVYTQTW